MVLHIGVPAEPPGHNGEGKRARRSFSCKLLWKAEDGESRESRGSSRGVGSGDAQSQPSAFALRRPGDAALHGAAPAPQGSFAQRRVLPGEKSSSHLLPTSPPKFSGMPQLGQQGLSSPLQQLRSHFFRHTAYFPLGKFNSFEPVVIFPLLSCFKFILCSRLFKQHWD